MAVNPVPPEDPVHAQGDGVWSDVPPPWPPRAGAGEAYGGAVEDAVDGAFAILAVAAALVRYAAESAVRGRPGVLARLTSPGHRSGLRRALHAPAQGLAHPASAVLRGLTAAADELVPEVTRAVLARLDIPGLVAEFVDLDRLAEMLDVDAVVARVDLDAITARLDLDT